MLGHLNKKLFAIIYRVMLVPGKPTFPENAAYTLVALIWAFILMALMFLVMGVTGIKLTPTIFYLYIGVTLCLLIISHNFFLSNDKYKLIIEDERYRKANYEGIILFIIFLVSFILLTIVALSFKNLWL